MLARCEVFLVFGDAGDLQLLVLSALAGDVCILPQLLDTSESKSKSDCACLLLETCRARLLIGWRFHRGFVQRVLGMSMSAVGAELTRADSAIGHLVETLRGLEFRCHVH